MIDRIRNLLQQGEGLRVEFKEAQGGIPKSVYETVCAFSNTQGGEILLGVKDNGKVIGIDPGQIFKLKKAFADTINNAEKTILRFIYPLRLLILKENRFFILMCPKAQKFIAALTRYLCVMRTVTMTLPPSRLRLPLYI